MHNKKTLRKRLLALLVVGLLTACLFPLQLLADEGANTQATSLHETSVVSEQDSSELSQIEPDAQSEPGEQSEPEPPSEDVATPKAAPAAGPMATAGPITSSQLGTAISSAIAAGVDTQIDMDDFNVSAFTGPIAITGTVNTDITIQLVASSPSTLRYTGANGGRHFTINTTGSGTLTLDFTNVTLDGNLEANANAYRGGVGVTGGNVVLRGLAVHNARSAASNGGGILITGGKVTLEDCTVTGGFAVQGGGVAITGGDVTLNRVTLSGNTATAGGSGLAVLGGAGSVQIKDCTVENNLPYGSTAAGVGIYIKNVGTSTQHVLIDGGSIAHNGTADDANTQYGAGLYIEDSHVSLQAVRITQNKAVQYQQPFGGGMYIKNSHVTLNSGTEVSYNTLTGSNTNGGGIYAVGSTLTLNNATVLNNTATNFGGGIYAESTDLTLQGANVSNNRENGLYVNGGNLNIHNSTISNNSSDYRGGGLYLMGASLTEVLIEDSTLQGNRADGSGGAIYHAVAAGTLTVKNTKLGGLGAGEGNTATAGGAILSTGTVKLQGSAAILGNVASSSSFGGGGIAMVASASTNNATEATLQKLSAEASVQFSGNTAAAGGYLLASEAHRTLHDARVFSTAFSHGYTSAWNNHDVLYRLGEPGTEPTSITVSYRWNYSGASEPFALVDNVEPNETFSAPSPAPQRTNYRFEGWYRSENCLPAELWNFALDTSDVDLTLYAKWTRVYTLSFNANGGSLQTPAPRQLAAGETTVNPGTPTRTGYRFVGWYDGGTRWNFGTGGTGMPARNVELLAQYEAIPYVATFCDVSGHVHAYYQLYYGDIVPRPSAPTRSGYIFAGWQLADGSSWSFGSPMPDYSLQFVAVWQPQGTGGGEQSSSSSSSRPIISSSTLQSSSSVTASDGASGSNPLESTSAAGASGSQTSLPGDVSDSERETQRSGGLNIPLMGFASIGDHWSVLNLAITLVMLVLSAVLVVWNGLQKSRGRALSKRARLWHIVSVLVGILSLPVFLFTQDLSKPAGMADVWTVLMAVLIAGQLAALLLYRRKNSQWYKG